MYTVEIGDRSTRIKHPVEEVSDYAGCGHNYDGIQGWLIDRAVKKMYGKNAYWFGEHDMLNRGQVFRPLKNNNASTSLTNRVVAHISGGA